MTKSPQVLWPSRSLETPSSHTLLLMWFMKTLIHGSPIVDHCSGQISDVVAAALLLLSPLPPPCSSLIFTPLFESSTLNYLLWPTPLCMLNRVVGMGMTPPAVQDRYQNGLSHSEYINPVHKDWFMAWAHDQSQWNLRLLWAHLGHFYLADCGWGSMNIFVDCIETASVVWRLVL